MLAVNVVETTFGVDPRASDRKARAVSENGSRSYEPI